MKLADRVEQFDFVIVGSGSAGGVIAARLSEDASLKILLLEAGPADRHLLQVMPLGFLKVATSTSVTWQYVTEEEPGLGGRRLVLPRGRVLGGSSSVNAMIAIRGNPADYDRWAALGNEGWSYQDVLPYFKRLEQHWRGEGPFHGATGPIAIEPVTGDDMLLGPLVESAEAAGVAFCDDPSGASQYGISRMEATVRAGRRSSVAREYVRPAQHRSNLTVRTGALATRLLRRGNRVTGVEYATGRKTHKAEARCEVVLCGGAYNTPQLLMLSGIGPADELRKAGLQPWVDLPGVGRNLSDHPNYIIGYELRDQIGLSRHLRLDRAAIAAARWFATGKGPFASTGAAANIFLRTQSGLDRPDAQMIAMPVANTAGLWWPGRRPPFCLSARIGPLHPKSRGWVKLRTTDPRTPPRICINMFADAGDLAAMVRAVRQCERIYEQPPLADLIKRSVSPHPVGCTDEELAAVIRREASHRAHPVGTCRMGKDERAVVDERLRVGGVEGLRIADASIMPELPSGNTNLPTIMIGEKAADMIRLDWSGEKATTGRPNDG